MMTKTKAKTKPKNGPTNDGRAYTHTVMSARNADYDVISGIARDRDMTRAAVFAAVVRGWNTLTKAQQNAALVPRK